MLDGHGRQDEQPQCLEAATVELDMTTYGLSDGHLATSWIDEHQLGQVSTPG